jgi:hypothetical protein
VRFSEAYMTWKAAMAVRGVRGQKYQTPGACPRGEAVPRIDAPSPEAAE